MNIAIVGFGSIGKYYLSIIKKFKFKKIYLIDVNFEKKIKDLNIYQISYEEFVKKKYNVNYAIICSPSYLHYKHAKYFLTNNVNVLIEKPFTLRHTHGLELVNLAKKQKLKCWTVFQNRLNPTIKFFKNKINKNLLGNINFIDCRLLWNRNNEYYNSNWRGKYKTDGGVLANQSIHLLDILIYLFGEIRNFTGNISFNKEKLESEDYISLSFNLKSNIPVSFVATTRANSDYEMSLDIFGSKKRLKIKGLALNELDFFDNKINKKYNHISYSVREGYGNSHFELLKEFLSNRNKDKYQLSIEKNMYLIKVLNSIYHYLLKKSNMFNINKSRSILGYGR